jgi:ribosome-binding protein aMBF1 (putative translation factor)
LHTAAVPKSAFSRKQRQLRALLTEARRDAGITQAALAWTLKRHQSFVSKYERGERRLDVVEFLEVTKALGTDPLRLIEAIRD